MNPLRHTPITIKVAVAPAFAIVCLLIVAGMGLWANSLAQQTLGQVSTARIPALGLAVDLERRIAMVHAKVNQSLVWEGAGVKAETIAALDKGIATDFDELAKLIDTQSSNAVWSEADRTTLKQLAQGFGKFKTTALETIDIKSTGLGAAAGFITRSESSYTELNRLIDDVVKRQRESTEREVAQAAVLGRKALFATAGGLALAVALSVLATWWCARLIARPLGRAVTVLKAVAAGDFTHTIPVESRDEVGQAADAVNHAVRAMQQALREVRVAATGAATASAQLSAASEQLSSGAQEQASSLEETAASLEQITSTVKQTADNARQANQLAVGSRETAEKGGAVVGSAVAAMDEINRASKRIAAIIATIDEIAFQTNLLALNAAVEAARAGEQGRGFAVVAAEVRNLAQRAATAAKEIKGLIQDSVGKVEAGSTLVTQAGATLGEIVASVKRVSDVIGEIAAASSEQTAGIEQVNRAVAQMDTVVQANAAQTEELSSTAQALAAQAEQLQDLVRKFEIDGAETARGGQVPALPESAAAPARTEARGTPERPRHDARMAGAPAQRRLAVPAPRDGHGNAREHELVEF
jgi:methyl-accepting chemotaxis protein